MSLLKSIFQKFIIIGNELHNQRRSFQTTEWKIDLPDKKIVFDIKSYLTINNYIRFIYNDLNVPKVEGKSNRKNMTLFDLFYFHMSNNIDRIDCTGHYWVDRNTFLTTNARICFNQEKQKLSPYDKLEFRSIIKMIHMFKIDRSFLINLNKDLSLNLVHAL